MLLGWAQCARCERGRASAIRADEFFEKYNDVSRQLAPGSEVCTESAAEFPEKELFPLRKSP
jgi:hypothetical protein